MTADPNQVISGLEGVLAFESEIAFIDGFAPEFSVRGYDIHDIAGRIGYEQLCFLLWQDRLPTDAELSDFIEELAGLREVPATVLDLVRAAPASTHPMATLRTAVSLLGMLDDSADDIGAEASLAKSKSLAAKMATIVAAQTRLQAGQDPIAPDPSLGHAANYYYMLTGRATEELVRATFDAVLVLYAEHETNASTFASRVVVGTESDFYSAVVAGIGAVKGPLHGGAIDGAMSMLIEIGSPDNAEAYVDDALAARRKLPGFGHRVYRAGDPRAARLRDMATEMAAETGDDRWLSVALAAEKRMTETKGIIPNVDYYAAPVLYQIGFPLNLMTNVVASSRIAGWSAHIMEQYANNRLIRPRALYKGHRDRKLPGG